MTENNLPEEIADWLKSAGQMDDKTPVEKGLELVEEAARFLERGELALEISLQIYEQSVKLTGLLQNRLEEARQKIEQLMPDGSTTAFGEKND